MPMNDHAGLKFSDRFKTPFRVVAVEVVGRKRRRAVTGGIEAITGVVALHAGNGLGHDAIRAVGQLLDTP